MPANIKGTTHTYGVLHIVKNTSLALPWNISAEHLSDLAARMKASGDNKQFCYETIQAGGNEYEKIKMSAGQFTYPNAEYFLTLHKKVNKELWQKTKYTSVEWGFVFGKSYIYGSKKGNDRIQWKDVMYWQWAVVCQQVQKY